MKFRPNVKFSVLTQVETSFYPGVKMYLQRFAAYFTKMFYGKRVSYAVTGFYINYDVRFHQQREVRCLIFNSFSGCNSKIVTASLLLNLYRCY